MSGIRGNSARKVVNISFEPFQFSTGDDGYVWTSREDEEKFDVEVDGKLSEEDQKLTLFHELAHIHFGIFDNGQRQNLVEDVVDSIAHRFLEVYPEESERIFLKAKTRAVPQNYAYTPSV